MATGARREFLISKAWFQAAILVMLFGFFVLGLLAYRTYMEQPPVPGRVVGANGNVLFTGEDISRGQQVFLHNGLMEYGSVFGHGAYLGPDYTADYLRRSSDLVRNSFGGADSDRAVQRTIEELRTNRYDEGADTLTFTPRQAAAFRRLVGHYSDFFSEPDDPARAAAGRDHRPDGAAPADGVLRLDGVGGVDEPSRPRLQLHQQLAAGAARRQHADRERDRLERAQPDRAPGRDRAPVRGVRALGAHSRLARARAGDALVPIAGRRRADAGAAGDRLVLLRHGRPVRAADLLRRRLAALPRRHRAASSAIDLAQVFPYNLMRTWHVQLAIFWVATSFVAAGIFLAPMIARREPKHQGKLAFALLGALAVVVFGTLIGSFLGIHGVLEDTATNWFGLQGFEYLDLARFWQVLLSIGLVDLGRDALARPAPAACGRAPRQHALAVLPRRLRDPRVLRGRADRPHRRQLHHHRVLALLGRPPLGGGLPRAVHDRDGRLHVRPARRRAGEGRADGDLPRHHPLLGRRRDRDDAPPLLLG